MSTWRAEDMRNLATAWLDEVESEPPSHSEDARGAVVLMNFTAPPEVQWAFLEAAIELSQTDDQLYAIAAGPFEHLLGHHGADYVQLFEEACRADRKLARMTTASRQYLMSDAVWARIKSIQASVPNPL